MMCAKPLSLLGLLINGRNKTSRKLTDNTFVSDIHIAQCTTPLRYTEISITLELLCSYQTL